MSINYAVLETGYTHRISPFFSKRDNPYYQKLMKILGFDIMTENENEIKNKLLSDFAMKEIDGVENCSLKELIRTRVEIMPEFDKDIMDLLVESGTFHEDLRDDICVHDEIDYLVDSEYSDDFDLELVEGLENFEKQYNVILVDDFYVKKGSDDSEFVKRFVKNTRGCVVIKTESTEEASSAMRDLAQIDYCSNYTPIYNIKIDNYMGEVVMTLTSDSESG